MKNRTKIIITGASILVISIMVIWTIQLSPKPNVTSDPKNITYTINGKAFNLINGKSTESGAAGEIINTEAFGEPVYGDLNKDGANEAVIYLTQSNGGSGTFFYAAAARQSGEKWIGTNSILLGDRIAPQNINIIDGVANFNFSIRRPSEPFTTSPSVGVTKKFIVKNGQLIEK